MKSQFAFFRRVIVVGLLGANASFVACSNSDGGPSATAGSFASGAASGANPGHGGNTAAAGHSGGMPLGGSVNGGADTGGSAHGGAGAMPSGGTSAASGGGGSPASAGSSNAGSGGSGGSAGSAGGASGSGHGGSAGAGPTMSATQAIFDQHCTNCHDANKSGLPSYPSLPLTSDAAYGALVSQPADETCGGIRVVPANSALSYLFRKVSDATPCDGLRMPHKPEVGPATPLSALEIETIRAWIDGGAQP